MAFFIMKKIISFLMTLIFVIGLGSSWVKAETEELKSTELYAKSAVLMDGNTKRVLYGKEEAIPLANASTTKILTCILALEADCIDNLISASSRAVRQPKVRLGITEGSQYKIKDLLYCLMLESFNDCAVAIAEEVAGSVEDFAVKMNDKAKEIGCQDTYFITPNGLDDKNEGGFHHTTAEDLCRIMAYCSWESPKAEEFREITQTMSYSFIQDGKNYSISNHNQLFSKIEGVVSGKTGYTNDAGYCYVASFERDGKRMCLALLGCGWPNNKNYKWKDSLTLLNYGLTHFEVTNIYEAPFLEKQQVAEGIAASSDLLNWRQPAYIEIETPKEKPKLEYLLAEHDEVSHKTEWKEGKTAPIKAGEVMGYHHIFLNDSLVYTEVLTAKESVEKWDFLTFFQRAFAHFFTL